MLVTLYEYFSTIEKKYTRGLPAIQSWLMDKIEDFLHAPGYLGRFVFITYLRESQLDATSNVDIGYGGSRLGYNSDSNHESTQNEMFFA